MFSVSRQDFTVYSTGVAGCISWQERLFSFTNDPLWSMEAPKRKELLERKMSEHKPLELKGSDCGSVAAPPRK